MHFKNLNGNRKTENYKNYPEYVFKIISSILLRNRVSLEYITNFETLKAIL